MVTRRFTLAGVISALLLSQAAIVAPGASAALTAQSRVKAPGVQYFATGAKIDFERTGDRVQVTLRDDLPLVSVTPDGQRGAQSLLSLQHNWQQLGMTRKGASFWIRPQGATRVVHLSAPRAGKDGAIKATATLAEWNRAVPPGLRVQGSDQRKVRSQVAEASSTDSTVALTSTSSLSPCPISVINWIGTCVLSAQYSGNFAFSYYAGLQVEVSMCWEMPDATSDDIPWLKTDDLSYYQGFTPVPAPDSVSTWGGQQQFNLALPGQCMNNSDLWVNVYAPNDSVDTGSYVNFPSESYMQSNFSFMAAPGTDVTEQTLYIRASSDPDIDGNFSYPLDIIVLGVG